MASTPEVTDGVAMLIAGADHRETILEQGLSDYEDAQRVLQQNPDRARRLFLSAAQHFQSLIASGIVNGRLEFNLGNCFLQAGDPGRAILHYRRAERLMPRDPLLAENLAVARSRCLTHIPAGRGSAVLRGLFFWHYQSSAAERLRGLVFAYALGWALLAARLFWRRRWLTVTTAVLFGLAASLASSLLVSHWSQRSAPPGVVTMMDVVVRNGPGPGYPRRFEQPLQPGVEFTLRERRGGWWNVELPDGQQGWIEAGSAELVVDSN